jgi:hypothetical protein
LLARLKKVDGCVTRRIFARHFSSRAQLSCQGR